MSIRQLRKQGTPRWGIEDGSRKKGSAARPPNDRRHRRRKGEREAIGDRPSTRLGTAEKPATLHGQSVAGYRRDRRGFQRARHSYLVTSASRNPCLSRLRLSLSPRRSPAPLRPHGLRDRRAERHHGYSPWTSVFQSRLTTHVPCVRAGGTTGCERDCGIPDRFWRSNPRTTGISDDTSKLGHTDASSILAADYTEEASNRVPASIQSM